MKFALGQVIISAPSYRPVGWYISIIDVCLDAEYRPDGRADISVDATVSWELMANQMASNMYSTRRVAYVLVGDRLEAKGAIMRAATITNSIDVIACVNKIVEEYIRANF